MIEAIPTHTTMTEAIPTYTHTHGNDETARIVWQAAGEPLHVYSVKAGYVVTNWKTGFALPDTFLDKASAVEAAQKWGRS